MADPGFVSPLVWPFSFGAVELPVEDPFCAPGKFPQGDPFGELPELFGVFGVIVDGSVLEPGVGVFGLFAPGTLGFVVPLEELDPGLLWPDVFWFGVYWPGEFGFCGTAGVAVLAGGVAVLAGGVAVLAGGVAVPGADAAPERACPAAKLAQATNTKNTMSLFPVIFHLVGHTTMAAVDASLVSGSCRSFPARIPNSSGIYDRQAQKQSAVKLHKLLIAST